MAERTSYPPGTFSWAELATSDADAAKAFYGELFGWSYDDNPIGDGQVYTMAQRDGGTAAALFQTDQPPHWNCYVTVASADDLDTALNKASTDLRREFDRLFASYAALLSARSAVNTTRAALAAAVPAR